MLPTARSWLLILRLGLIISAFGWSISFYFTFHMWPEAVEWLYGMGAGPIDYQPLLGYWLKMASAVFGCIGVVAALAAFRPGRYVAIIHFLAWLHLVVGVTL